MSKNYDNWERLVAAVLFKEELKRIALSPSIVSSAISSRSSSFKSLLHDHLLVYNGQIPLARFNFETFSTLGNQEISSRPASISCFLDEKTGKKSCIVGARDLKISLGNNNPQNWKWSPDADSRFSEVAELQSIWQLDIRGKIRTRMLDSRTVYAAYLVLKMGERVGALESAKAVIRFVDDESDTDAAKRARIVHFQPAKDTRRDSLLAKVDGWMEIKMGNFYRSQGDDGEVEARLLENRRWKSASLIVEGILFRPTYTYTEIPLVSKQYSLSTVRA